jgi:hypothetical protein
MYKLFLIFELYGDEQPLYEIQISENNDSVGEHWRKEA